MFGQRQRHDGRVELALAQQFEQAHGEIFLQDQRHLRHLVDQPFYQRRQQIGADRVDHAEPQRPGQRILVLLGQFLDGGRLLEHPFGLGNDLRAERRDRHFGAAAFEQHDAEFVFEFLDGHRQGRLGNVARLGGMAEMSRTRDGNDIFQFSEGHG